MQQLPSDTAGAIEYLTDKEGDITKDSSGHAIRLMVSGQPAMPASESALIGLLVYLQQRH